MRRPQMTRPHTPGTRKKRPIPPLARKWLVGLAIVEIIALPLTIHSALTYHDTNDGPTVMPLGQALGWIIIGVGLIAAALIVKESRR